MGQTCCYTVTNGAVPPTYTLFYVSRDAVEVVFCDARKAEAERVYTWDSLLKAEAKYCSIATGELFVAGGRDAVLYHSGKSQFKSSTQCFSFNTQTHLISAKPDMQTGRQGHLLLSDHEAVYALGGYSEYMGIKTCEKLLFEENQWEVLPAMKEVRINAAGCICSNRIFVTGGFSHLAGSPSLTIETFDFSLNHWTTCDLKLPSALEKHACVPYCGGLFIFGGYQEDDVPNYCSFWLSLSENRVMQKQCLSVEAEFAGQIIAIDDVIYAYESRSGRRLFVFKEDRWSCTQVKISNLSKTCD